LHGFCSNKQKNALFITYNLCISKKNSNFASQSLKKGDKTMCMYNLALNDELVKRTRQSFANEEDMMAWLQRQVEALMIEYNTSQQTVRRSARAAIAAMRRQSELNGNAEMSLQDINTEIQQARLSKKTTAQ
jgi:hypothetical protein